MNLLRKLAAAVVAVAMASSVAAPAAQAREIAGATPYAFDWGGAYVGAYTGAAFAMGALGGIPYGLRGGYNFVNGRVVAGVETRVGGAWSGGHIFDIGALARAGLLVHESVLIYAITGLGWSNQIYADAGGGVEFGLGTNLSLFVDGRITVGGFGCCVIFMNGGVTWHP